METKKLTTKDLMVVDWVETQHALRLCGINDKEIVL